MIFVYLDGCKEIQTTIRTLFPISGNAQFIEQRRLIKSMSEEGQYLLDVHRESDVGMHRQLMWSSYSFI